MWPGGYGKKDYESVVGAIVENLNDGTWSVLIVMGCLINWMQLCLEPIRNCLIGYRPLKPNVTVDLNLCFFK